MPERPGPPETRGRGEGLSRRQRLTRASAFLEAYGQGRKQVGRYMVMWLRAGEGASLRLGVVSGRKVGGAVQRNRARRRLREVFRRHRHRCSGPWDVVIVARRAIVEAPHAEVTEDFLRLARRAGLLGREEAGG